MDSFCKIALLSCFYFSLQPLAYDGSFATAQHSHRRAGVGGHSRGDGGAFHTGSEGGGLAGALAPHSAIERVDIIHYACLKEIG
jgi:hypothetical protein